MSLVTSALRALHALDFDDVSMTIAPAGDVVATVPCARERGTDRYDAFTRAVEAVARERGWQVVVTRDRTQPMRAYVAHWFMGGVR